MLKVLVIFFVLTYGVASWASLYSCKSPESEPSLILNQNNVELLFKESVPVFKATDLNVRNLENKKPFLIYYAIDSTEAFMKYSVRYEVARLLKSCKSNSKVNFVALINSLFVDNNEFLVCKDQQARYVNLREFPSLNNSLNEKKSFIIQGDHTSGQKGPLKYMTKYFPEANGPFGKYLLAHPDFVYELINLVSNEESLFPSHTYAPFINLKSHGSQSEVLAGMYECQEKAKELSAEKVISGVLSEDEIKTLEKLKSLEEVEANLEVYEQIISKIDLGNNRGIGGFGSTNLGHSRLGSTVSGLGVNQGLGAETAFGTIQIALSWILDDLYPSGSKKSLGFLMLESCDTNRYPSFFHEYLDNVFGYYSAKRSLWYRNLNWWDMLERANGSTEELVRILREETPKIINIEVVPKP